MAIFAYRRFPNSVLYTSVNRTSQFSVRYCFSKHAFISCNVYCNSTGGLFIHIVYIINSLCGRFSVVVSLACSVFFFTIVSLIKWLCRPSTLFYLPHCCFQIFVTVIYYVFYNRFHKSSSRFTTFNFSHHFSFDYYRIIHEFRYIFRVSYLRFSPFFFIVFHINLLFRSLWGVHLHF